MFCRSQWPRGLRRRSAAARLLRLWVRIPLGVACCQTSLRRADHSSRGVLPTVMRRWVWSRNLVNEEALTHWGLWRQKKKENKSRVLSSLTDKNIWHSMSPSFEGNTLCFLNYSHYVQSDRLPYILLGCIFLSLFYFFFLSFLLLSFFLFLSSFLFLSFFLSFFLILTSYCFLIGGVEGYCCTW